MFRKALGNIQRISTTRCRKNPVGVAIKSAFGKYLLLTNTVSSGVLMGLGDLIQQEIEFQRSVLSKRYDYVRMTRMFLVGLAFGPLHHYYYSGLNIVLPKGDLPSVFIKILADQILMSPICIALFFYGMAALEERTLDDANKELKEKFFPTYKVDWIVWPPAQFLNFYYLPKKYQVFYINVITMLYDVFLSYIKFDYQNEAE